MVDFFTMSRCSRFLFLFLNVVNLSALSSCKNVDSDVSSEAQEGVVKELRVLEFEDFGFDEVRSRCVEHMGRVSGVELLFRSDHFAPRLVNPELEVWTAAALAQGAVRVSFKLLDAHGTKLNALLGMLTGFKAPRFLPLYLEGPDKISGTSFQKRASKEEDLFWDVQVDLKGHPYFGLCEYLKDWVRAQQILRGKIIHPKTRVLKLSCNVDLVDSAAIRPLAQDSLQVTRLPVPFFDTVNANFPIAQWEDCSLKNLVKKLKI